MAKQLIFDVQAREAIRQGVNKLARAVISTLGPRGRNAVLDKSWGGPTITKDGVSVAEEIDLKDPYENMGARLVREVASKTSDVAGDGTTTATLLATEIVNQGIKFLTAGANPAELNRGIRKAAEKVKEELEKMAKPVPEGDLSAIVKVASIAANNDPSVGKMIAEALEKVGRDGVITVEEGKSRETEVKVVEGMQFDRGYLTPHFATDQDTMECKLENAFILIHEDKISNVRKLLPLLEKIKNSGKPLLIIAEDVEGEALATLVVNRLRGTISCCAVKAPGYGDRRKAMLQDIAILTGAKKPLFKDMGLELDKIDVTDLGRAKKVTVDKDNTIILEGAGNPADVSARAKQIRREIEDTTSDYDREKLQERLAKLTGGVAQINVGALTETELKERKALVEDALHATRAAIEEGILPGGGVALLRASLALEELKLKGDEEFGLQVLRRACAAPLRKIAENAGEDGALVERKVLAQENPEYGYNALTGEYGNMIDFGVMDPAKVTVSALVNAVSVGTLLLTTDALIVEKKEEKEDEESEDYGGMDYDY